MSTATPFSSTEYCAIESAETDFRSIFERAPIRVARCNPQGVIVESNPAFQQALDPDLAKLQILRLCDLVPTKEQEAAKGLLRALLDCKCESIRVEGKTDGAADGQAASNWTGWRLPASGGKPPHALLMAMPTGVVAHLDENLMQNQRWQSVGRLAGGVAHDFNNLLTGVMLYCDLLLSTMDVRDNRRRYVDEIRSTTLQANDLVRQLLAFARPQPGEVHALCLNEIIQSMQNLLVRLIGGNIQLEFRLDRNLGLVKIDPSQAQQIIMNLVLNARDALTEGGRLVVETSNCRFQGITGSTRTQCSDAIYPCVLLVVSDNGCGMDAKTRQRVFEPFFTTKIAGQGTGLGLPTVRSIVATAHGLIHIASEAGEGTQALVLLPGASEASEVEFLQDSPPPSLASHMAIHSIKKESTI